MGQIYSDVFDPKWVSFQPTLTNRESSKLYQRPKEDLNEISQRELDRRLAYVSAIREAAPQAHTHATLIPIRDAVAKRIQDPNPPSFSALYKWAKADATFGNYQALIPRYDRRGPAQPRQALRIIELFTQATEDAFHLSPEATVKKVCEHFIALISKENSLRPPHLQYKIPSQATCYRLFSRLDQYDTAVLREGKRIAGRKFKLAGPGTVTTHILERAEIDHTPLDLFLIDENTGLPLGRPTLTLILDHHSRMPLGYHLGFNAPSAAAVLSALRHAILPKKKFKSQIGLVIHHEWPCYGLMDVLVMDNGLEFHGKSLEYMAFNLGIRLQYCPKKQPQFKGAIERYLKTINYSFAHLLPGTSFAHFYKRGDYDPQEHAVLTLTEFKELFEKWLLDVYAVTIHRSLKTTPLEKWNNSAKDYPLRLPESVDQLANSISTPCRRSLRHDGIMLHGLYYSGDGLEPILRRFGPGVRVTITYDPEDLGTINVFDPDSNEISHPAYAKAFHYANGRTLSQHRLIQHETIRRGQSAHDPVELAITQEEIREKVDELAVSRKHSERRLAARIRGERKKVEAAKNATKLEGHGRIQWPENTSSFSNHSMLDPSERTRLSTFKMGKPGGA